MSVEDQGSNFVKQLLITLCHEQLLRRVRSVVGKAIGESPF